MLKILLLGIFNNIIQCQIVMLTKQPKALITLNTHSNLRTILLQTK